MLTVYPNSELFQEIQSGNWKEEGEIEKYQEMKTLVEHLQIPVFFGAMGASNAVQLTGKLTEDREQLISALDGIIRKFSEEELRQYRKNLPHL